MTKHINNGSCPRCEELFQLSPAKHEGLHKWFKELQAKQPASHCSAVWRSRSDQEDAFRKGTSKAHFGQSPHSYGLACDLFRLTLNGADFSIDWYKSLFEDAEKAGLECGGKWPKFKDYPHFEVKNWKDLVISNKLKLVE